MALPLSPSVAVLVAAAAVPVAAAVTILPRDPSPFDYYDSYNATNLTSAGMASFVISILSLTTMILLSGAIPVSGPNGDAGGGAGGVGAAAAAAPSVCNGRAEYCSRIYSNVTQIGSHDAAFVGVLPTQNQHLAVADQLTRGIRFMEVQTHKKPGDDTVLEACHTSCFEEDAGSVVDFLRVVKAFLDGNPDEVITLLLTNGDNVDVGLFNDALGASGIDTYLFTPSTGAAMLPIDQWPTLSDMITSGKRLVFFLDTGADTSRFPAILDEFSYFFETPFDTTDPNFGQCKLDRPANGSPDGRMYIVNHFLDKELFAGILVPDEADADKTNAATGPGSIGAQVALCTAQFPRNPKSVLVDYMDKGDVFTAEKNLNGVSE